MRDGVFIHPMAVVHDDCKIGKGTKIWQFASILRGAELGEDCTVASGACFDGSRAGSRTILSHNLAAGPGFWLGDDVFIGPNCCLGNDAWPRARKDGFDVRAFDGTRWAIVIEHGASVGAMSMVLPGVTIGRNAMIAAGSVVSKNVPANHLFVKGVCKPIAKEADRMRFAQEELGLVRQ